MLDTKWLRALKSVFSWMWLPDRLFSLQVCVLLDRPYASTCVYVLPDRLSVCDRVCTARPPIHIDCDPTAQVATRPLVCDRPYVRLRDAGKNATLLWNTITKMQKVLITRVYGSSLSGCTNICSDRRVHVSSRLFLLTNDCMRLCMHVRVFTCTCVFCVRDPTTIQV